MPESRIINIVCLKWGHKYGAEYVNRLSRAVARNVRARSQNNYRFWCFTDDPQGIDSSVLIHDLPLKDRLDIWWNKLWLFSADMPMAPGEPIFYIDLDTLITSDITDILSRDYDRITVLRDFYQGLARSAGEMGSGLMAWRHGQYTGIWEEFWQDPERHVQEIQPLGDQRWVELQTQGQRDYWQDIWPHRVVSFKVHCRWGLPDQASIVCYHGLPTIPDSAVKHTKDWKWKLTPQPWVLEHWRD